MASNRSRLPWTPPEYQRDRRAATINTAESQQGRQKRNEMRPRENKEEDEAAAANGNTMQQPELPFGLLLKKAIRGDTHAVTIEEALEHLETIAKDRVEASVDPELDPNARVDMWLNQSKEYLDDGRMARPDEQEEPMDEAAFTLGSLSMMASEEEKGERSERPQSRVKESRDEN